jgi:hypothetical protein
LRTVYSVHLPNLLIGLFEEHIVCY